MMPGRVRRASGPDLPAPLLVVRDAARHRHHGPRRHRIPLLSLLCTPVTALAHSGAQGSRDAGELFLIALLFATAAWYAIGFWRVLCSSAGGRDTLVRRGVLFASGWLVMAGSLLSPLHELGGRSFTAHMFEHELLMLLAAPLVAFSRPIGVLLWAFPRGTRHALGALGHQGWFSGMWRSISSPLGASLIQAAMLWLWHVPAFFDRALRSETWHAAQHLSFVFSALLFWWSINQASALERKHGVAGFWLFFTSLHSALLGALMAFAGSPWYARYAELGLSGPGGLTPLEDQQIAGLIMWIPGGAVHAIAALVYLSRWFRMPRKAVTAVTSIVLALVAASMYVPRAHAHTVYVSNEELDVVHVIDGSTLRPIGQIATGKRPRGMAMSADGNTLYVAVSNDNRIDVVDLSTRQVVGQAPSGPDPEVIALHPDGRHIYVANEADNLMSVVDIAARRIIAEVPVGTEPEGLAVSPDGQLAVCTSEASSMAHFVSLQGRVDQPALVDNVMVDTRPRYAAFTADSRYVWVSSEIRGTVAVFDTADRKRIALIDFERARPDLEIIQAVGIQITKDASRAFVGLGRGNAVAEVNPRDFSIVRYFPAGFRVWNIALSPDESRLYAAAGLSSDVTVIDLATNEVTGTIKLGGKPWGVVAR